MIIYESTLLKYHAGLNSSTIERWCQVSGQYFKYFKNQWSSLGTTTKAMTSIPLSDIREVRRVNYKLKDKAQQEKKLYQFEIFLHDNAEFHDGDANSTPIKKSPSKAQLSALSSPKTNSQDKKSMDKKKTKKLDIK